MFLICRYIYICHIFKSLTYPPVPRHKTSHDSSAFTSGCRGREAAEELTVPRLTLSSWDHNSLHQKLCPKLGDEATYIINSLDSHEMQWRSRFHKTVILQLKMSCYMNGIQETTCGYRLLVSFKVSIRSTIPGIHRRPKSFSSILGWVGIAGLCICRLAFQDQTKHSNDILV